MPVTLRSILPLGTGEPEGTWTTVAAMRLNGIDSVCVNDENVAAASGSSMTVPAGVVPAAIAGTVPNFLALASFGSLTPLGAR